MVLEVSRKELPGRRRGGFPEYTRWRTGNGDHHWEGRPAGKPTPAALTDQRLQALARGGVPDPTATQNSSGFYKASEEERPEVFWLPSKHQF